MGVPRQVQRQDDRRPPPMPSTWRKTASCFREAMLRIGLEEHRARTTSRRCRRRSTGARGYRAAGHHPALLHASGGTGGGIAYNKAEFIEIVERGIGRFRPTNEVLIEEAVLGLEGIRDGGRFATATTNCIIICSIEKPRSDGRGIPAIPSPSAPRTHPHRQGNTRSCADALDRGAGARSGWRPAARNVQFAVNPKDGPPSSSSR